MPGPVQNFIADRFARSGVDTISYRVHRDAAIDRTNTDTKVATNTLFVDHLKLAFTINRGSNGLVRSIFTDDMAAPAFDA